MLWMLAGLTVLILLVLLRAIIGPTIIDRFIAVNAITTKVSMIILLIAFLKHDFGLIDVVFVYMLCGFVGGLWILKVLTPGVWQFKISDLKNTKTVGGKWT